MLAADGTPFTAHSTNPVPFIVFNYPCKLREGGVLADIAPTMLKMLGLTKPEEKHRRIIKSPCSNGRKTGFDLFVKKSRFRDFCGFEHGLSS